MTDTRPLDGILVADFSRVLAGPSAAMTLADLGATVIKVEHPDGGDDTRRWGPPFSPTGSTYFDAMNRTKSSVALDLADADDLAAARELADRADVLVENFRTGSLDRFGLDAASTLARNPRLVHCSITGFGSGAGAAIPGYDFVVQALGGLMSVTGEPDGEPQKVGVALVDMITGKDAVIGILAALRHRDLTGRGQHVEVNLLSSLLGSMANQASAYLGTGEVPVRMGNGHPSIAPYETLRCADGPLAVACGNNRQFAKLCDVLGISETTDDPRFAANADRVRHRPALVDVLEAALAHRTSAEWERLLVEIGVPAGRVNDVAGGIQLAVDLGLDPLVDTEDGPTLVAHPVHYSGFTPQPPTAPPMLGQHDREVRRWLAAPPVPAASAILVAPATAPARSEESA